MKKSLIHPLENLKIFVLCRSEELEGQIQIRSQSNSPKYTQKKSKEKTEIRVRCTESELLNEQRRKRKSGAEGY